MRRTTRNLLLALLLVAIVVLTAGHRLFQGAPTTTSTTSTTVPAATSTSTPTSTPTSTSTSTSTTTTVGSLTSCRGSGFTGANIGSQGAAGTGYDTMVLTKVSAGSCVVDGYPLLTLQNAHGTVAAGFRFTDAAGFPGAPSGGTPSAHTVSAGEKIDVQFRYSDVPVGNEVCPSVGQVNLQFVPGDTSVPITFTYPLSPCASGGIGVSGFYPA